LRNTALSNSNPYAGTLVLRGLGTAIDEPQRDAKLKELERRAVGDGMAARTGHRFLDKVPEGFRGHVKAGPDGAPYFVVTDGSRFVLLPASRELRALDGRAVGVSRDRQGRLRVGPPDRGLERWYRRRRKVAVGKTAEKEWTPKRLRQAVAAGTNAEKVPLLKEIGVLRRDGTLARGSWNWAMGPTRTPELAGW
jgi:hypothetical protein